MEDAGDQPARVRHKTPQYTTEALPAVAAYLPTFEEPDFQFVEVIGNSPSTANGFQSPGFHYHVEVMRLLRTLERFGWVYGNETFTWTSWKGILEASRLRDDPDALAQITSEQLAKLMTIFARQELFCDGAMLSYWESVLLTGILCRVDSLANEKGRFDD